MASRCCAVAGPAAPACLTRAADDAIACRVSGLMCGDAATVASAAACGGCSGARSVQQQALR
jgi:hypothetical protein